MTLEEIESLETQCERNCRRLEGDPAAVRSLKRKLAELIQEPGMKYGQAREELDAEYLDCLPCE